MEFGGLFGVLVLVADVFAIIKIWQSSATDGEKIVWIIFVALLPLIGLIAWYFVGPGDKALKW
ncbi:PLDc_N domain-containing protein [Spongiibacter nanhainus]|uniref:PLDc_N domain-containing protein n=1 Tax=Spongiibacter nanhainus TaxID=2794344 RepID=A0A7T4QXM9_9GAMM|nr:PLD nuclease N-terminal domain-containing protein [Spongiibacter nanhainus]QQD16619.1 PLDc_N domain-containing protein [Spongiibacter nanhainus]